MKRTPLVDSESQYAFGGKQGCNVKSSGQSYPLMSMHCKAERVAVGLLFGVVNDHECLSCKMPGCNESGFVPLNHGAERHATMSI
jgi:hypothetical protein